VQLHRLLRRRPYLCRHYWEVKKGFERLATAQGSG
jgi:hypothetical protein